MRKKKYRVHMSEQIDKLPDIHSEQMITIKILSYLQPNLLTIQARKKSLFNPKELA
jgi:hypothetical protein